MKALLAFLGVLLLAGMAGARIPHLINIQGSLTSGGTPYTGTIDLGVSVNDATFPYDTPKAVVSSINHSAIYYAPTPTNVAVRETGEKAGDVYIVEPTNHVVLVYDISTMSVPKAAIGGNLYTPESVALDSSGNLWVTDTYSGRNDVVKVSDPSGTGTQTVISGTFLTPKGIAIDSSGNVWVTNYGNGTVSRINSGSTSVSTTISVGTNPDGIAADPKNNLIWVANGGSSTVSTINPSTNTVTYTFPNTFGANRIAVDIDGYAWIGRYTDSQTLGSKMYRLNYATKTADAVTGFQVNLNVFSIAPDGMGNVWITGVSNNTAGPNGDLMVINRGSLAATRKNLNCPAFRGIAVTPRYYFFAISAAECASQSDAYILSWKDKRYSKLAVDGGRFSTLVGPITAGTTDNYTIDVVAKVPEGAVNYSRVSIPSIKVAAPDLP